MFARREAGRSNQYRQTNLSADIFQSTNSLVLCSTCCPRWLQCLNDRFTCSGAETPEREVIQITRHNRKQEQERELARQSKGPGARCGFGAVSAALLSL